MLSNKRIQRYICLLIILFVILLHLTGVAILIAWWCILNIEASFILVMEHLKSMVRYRGEVSFFSLSSGGFKFDD